LFHQSAREKCVIVISHDCDLPHEKEEEVDIIVGTKIPTVDSNYTAARNVRCLHLSYRNEASSESVCIELQHSGRKSVAKWDFANIAKLEANLPSDEKRTLKQWLAARYGRPAFPNEFENRLQNNKKFHEKLIKLLKPINKHLIGIFFDLGEERLTELPAGTPYCLRMSLTYKSIDGPIAREATKDCAISITNLFHSAYGTPNVATNLVLESCEAVADTLFSLADLQRVDQWWRYDYISLQESPAPPLLALGAISA